jgi:hypothetical protein
VIELRQAFSSGYAQARVRFLEAAATAGLAIESHLHPLPGRDGETLAMDVALAGSPDARHLLVVSSACHGVEGYCGSGVQVHALHDEEWHAHASRHGVAVLYIHALNPYGFSHLRRVTQENVDLNRNFQDFSGPLPANAAYGELHPLLLPAQWPPDAANEAAISAYVQAHGMARFQTAVTQGQHDFADGMFFGGHSPTWSNRVLREVLRRHVQVAQQLAWIDIHTGLGPSGLGERIFAAGNDAATLQRARAWWGGGGATPVTSFYDGSSSSSPVRGMLFNVVYDECRQAQYTGIAMEYGTLPLPQMIQALRAEHWLHRHPQAPAAQAAEIRQQMLDAFYVDTDAWKGQIISQARQAMFQAVCGLSGNAPP